MPQDVNSHIEKLIFVSNVDHPFLDTGKEIIDGNVVEECRGYNQCKDPYLVFADITNDDRRGNDPNSAWRTGDIVTFALTKEINGVFVPTTYTTTKVQFANESNAWYTTIEWRDVAISDGYGCYKLTTNASIAGFPQPFITWGIYTLAPYMIGDCLNPSVVGTSRVLSEFNDMNDNIGLDFTGSFILDSVRLSAKVGYFNDNTEIDMVEYIDGKNEKVQIEDFTSYELRINLSGFFVIEMLRMHLLGANNQWLSDYNYDSYSYLTDDIAVVLKEGLEPEFFDGSREIKGVVKFRDKISKRRTHFLNNRITSEDVRPPILCPQAIIINKSTFLLKTDAQSFISGDDGSDQEGRQIDRDTLDFDNSFGNDNRFTDTSGGTTYSNDIVIDWSQLDKNGDVMMYHRVKQPSTTLTLAIAAAKAATVSGFVGWEVPNMNQAHEIANWNSGGNRALGTPFATPFSSGIFWTKTFQNSSVTWNYTYTGNGIFGRIAFTGSQQYFMVRRTTMAELGL